MGSMDILAFIAEWDFIESLPNFMLTLKLFLTIVSVASCERSFSKLKLKELFAIHNGTVEAF